MININKKFYKLTTLLIMLSLCFVVTGCKKNVSSSQDGWTCTCGTVNTSNFCGNCGKQKVEQKVQQEQKQATNSNPFKNAKVGDYVKFGNYPQTEIGQEKPIEWQVLAKENNKMLVISRYGLDAKRFDDDSNDWENSEIRQWLNGYFYNKAFNVNEKKLINPSNLSDVCTTDNVFLLSKEEAENYFANDEERRCKATDYAVKNSAYVYDGSCGGESGYSWWWLRSPGSDNSSFVYSVNFGGNIDDSDVALDFSVVRSALWINIDFEQDNLDLKVDSSLQVSNYNNQKEKQNSVNLKPLTSANVGDYVEFGNYPQSANGDIKLIEWQVLAKENNKMLVISRYGLDAKRFDDDSSDWENSEIRKWLNGDFYNKTFNEKEKKLINHSNLSDVATTDNVFLLSKEEAEKYFSNNVVRKCKATNYAVKNGAWVYDRGVKSAVGYSVWWLRSPNSDYVYSVKYDGYVSDFSDVGLDFCVARPALWINFNLLNQAGAVKK